MGFDKAKVVRAAEKFLAQNKIPSAIQEYRRIVEHDAGDFNALNTLGDLYVRQNQKGEAVNCYQRVAEHYRRQGFVPKAVAVYKKITRIAPETPQVGLALAALYEQQGLVVDARAQYMQVAEAFARAGQKQDSLDALRRVADLDPNNVRVRLRLAESYAAEKLNDHATEAYIEAGARLLARQEHAAALDAFERALAWRPHSHAALHGLIAAHAALGTAERATDALERAVRERPGDTELYAMLARACLEAHDASRAAAAVRALVEQDPSSYELFFDVARLHLDRGDEREAVAVLESVAEQAMAAKRDEALGEVLQEVLARDPEMIEALRLQVLLYSARRDDESLRAALENVAEVSEARHDEEGEREALARLVKLAPYEWRFHERLNALNGVAPDAAAGTVFETAPAAEGTAVPAKTALPPPDEVPTFESFMLPGEESGGAANEPAGDPRTGTTTEFEFNSLSAPDVEPSSFADLNEFTDSAGTDFAPARDTPKGLAPRASTHDSGVAADFAAVGDVSYAAAMLAQELESVDFYIEQGYADIARDTLDILEKQYGAQSSIGERRERLGAADAPDLAAVARGEDFFAPAPDDSAATATQQLPPPDVIATTAHEEDAPAPQASAAPDTASFAPDTTSPTTVVPSLDPTLAAFIAEFGEDEEADSSGAVAASTSGADFETHYNMGLAYREMELLDQAVDEFQRAAALCAPGDGTARYLNCCNMLGHCLLGKGTPHAAAVWFAKGLRSPGHTEDEYQALRYELGTAYERMGDIDLAVQTFGEVYGVDVSYRNVADKLRELQALKAAR